MKFEETWVYIYKKKKEGICTIKDQAIYFMSYDLIAHQYLLRSFWSLSNNYFMTLWKC